MPNASFRKTAALALTVIIALVAAIAFAGREVYADKMDHKVGLILSHLPPASSDEYRALRKLAGKADGQALAMTKSEMWNVPGARVEALIVAAERLGVTVTRLDETWNRTLAPMKDGTEMSPDQKAMMHEMTDSKAVLGMSMMALPEASVLEYALTKDMDTAGSDTPGPVLVIPLNDKLSVTARRTGIAKTPENYIWHGRIEESDDPVTLLWWPSGRLTGSVTYKGHVYAVKSIGGGMHGVIEMAPNALPPEHAPMSRDMQEKMNMKEDPLVHQGDASMLRQTPGPEKRSEKSGGTPSDKPDRSSTKNQEDAPLDERARSEKLALAIEPPKARKSKAHDVVITVLVAYTKAAASHYSNIETDLIALAIEDANQSFRSSGIGQVRLELVHAYETDYVESGSHFDHVFRFADKGDGYMDEVHALRDQYKADVAVLIVHDPQGCGLAAQVVAPADRAFAVVHHECAATSYSLAHEIGHLIGARHDLALDDDMKPFPYGHGYVDGTKWRTMMSYKESCDGCPRVPVWSNPAIKIRGEPAGDAKSNNARVIAEQAARVAAFR
jgi:hypothetical protein